MLFNSYEFIFAFLPITFLGYFGLARCGTKPATLWLVLASFFFYGWWDYRYVPLLFGSICWNYIVGRKIENGPDKKTWLVLGLIVNVLLLGYFKYTDFFISNANSLLGTDYNLLHIVLPLGISFFTFTQSAYLVDAYRGEAKNDSFLTYCEFVTIFPHLIAGPIINHKDMIPQFIKEDNFKINWDNMAMGITLFTAGLFKKVVIADSISPWVNSVFNHVDSLSMIEAWIGALGYTFQLYFDFSGYSEMAIGLGLMFNMKFPVNFNSPYQATSIIDFWRRWHMTLGGWVKNYLYIPMGGNRHGELKKMRNLLVSMLIIGFWHGAGWTFIIWGAMHGVLLVINHQWRRLHIELPKLLCWLMTFVFVMVAWVLFRAETFADGLKVLSAMVDFGNICLPAGGWYENKLSWLQAYGIGFKHWEISYPLYRIGFILAALMVIVKCVPNPLNIMAARFNVNKKWLIITILLFLLAMYKMNKYSEFLYFQF